MAIAYVSTTGSAPYPGTASTPTSLSSALSSAAAGDTVYIATGVYRAAYTLAVSGTSGSQINFTGDSTNAQNIVGSSGYIVRITNYIIDTASPTDSPVLTASGRSYVNFTSLYFDAYSTTGVIALSAGTNITFTKCVFATTTTGHGVQHTMTSATGPALSLTKCVYVGNAGYLWRQLGNFTVTNMACYVTDCCAIGGLWFVNGAGLSIYTQRTDNVYFYNNTVFQGSSNAAVQMQVIAPGTSTMYFYNNFIVSTTAISNVISTTLAENYNTFIGSRSNIATLSANDRTTTSPGFAFDYGLLTGTVSIPFFGPYLGSVNQGVGTLTSAPVVDLYSRSWSTGTPDIGAITNFANTGVTAYLPTERNASTITIAPDTTSRAVYVYLGATGLLFSTTGLAAFYTRGKAAPVAITLVTQTVTGAYASGGFVEVSSTNQPGIYRLDLPNAALVDGVDDVTVTVRGAAGTNGAVLTISLVAEPSSAVVVRMGPYQIKADGLGSSQPLDINVSAVQGIDTQVVDANGSGIDITASTLSVKVYDSGGILVATYAGTATYAADGRLTFGITTAVTGTAGTYTATITRTTSASDTQVFGPLRLYVRSV